MECSEPRSGNGGFGAGILLLVFGGLMVWTIYQGVKRKDDSLANEIETETAEKAMPLKRAVFWRMAGLSLLIASSRITRFEGAALLLVYVGYTAWLISTVSKA